MPTGMDHKKSQIMNLVEWAIFVFVSSVRLGYHCEESNQRRPKTCSSFNLNSAHKTKKLDNKNLERSAIIVSARFVFSLFGYYCFIGVI